jgi:Na+/H+-dicarboxylate symporter
MAAPTESADSQLPAEEHGAMDDVLRGLHPRSLLRLTATFQKLAATRLWLRVLIGMVLGLVAGMALGPEAALMPREVGSLIVEWIALPGLVFLALLQMLVVPLVVASVIRGLAASASLEQLKRAGPRVGAWFVTTSTVSVGLGLGAGLLIRPGRFVPRPEHAEALSIESTDPPSMAELPGTLMTLLPDNPLGSMVEGQMLQVVIFSLIVGVALITMKPAAARPSLELLGSVQEVCTTVMNFAMQLAPIAVFGLLARLTASTGIDALIGVGAYVLTVLGALLILFALYLGAATLLGGQRPRAFLRAIREAQLLAFSTSSAAAVLPVSLDVAQNKLGVRPSIARLVLPLGATINMDGTAVFQGVATVFLAQVFGVDLSAGALAMVVATAVGASLGSPSTPGAGVILLAMVLQQVGIPADGIALIIGVDRLVDMSRSALNCTGDLTACVVLDRWIGGEMTRDEEVEAEAQREEARRASGHEVLTAA